MDINPSSLTVGVKNFDDYIAAARKEFKAAAQNKVLDALQQSNAAAAAINAKFIALPMATWTHIVSRCVVTGVSQEFMDQLAVDLFNLDRSIH